MYTKSKIYMVLDAKEWHKNKPKKKRFYPVWFIASPVMFWCVISFIVLFIMFYV